MIENLLDDLSHKLDELVCLFIRNKFVRDFYGLGTMDVAAIRNFINNGYIFIII